MPAIAPPAVLEALHLASDFVIGVAYVAIAATLVVLVRRCQPGALPYPAVFLAFASFILGCGATHFGHVLVALRPDAWPVLAAAQVVTLVASVATAVALPPLIPKAVALVRQARLSADRQRRLTEQHAELERLYARLQERSEARARRLVEANIIGVIVTDLVGGIRDANDAFLALVGYTRADLTAGRLRWDALTPTEHAARDDEAVAALRQRGVAEPWEKEYLHRDGHRVPVLVGAALVDEEDGECVAFVLDLSERQRAEADRARMAAIVEASADAIISKSADDIIVSWNPGAERLYGYTAAEAVGRKLPAHLPPEKVDEYREIHRRALAGEPVVGLETERRHKDGHTVPISLSLSPIRDAAGAVVGIAAVAHDITERKLLEARAEAARAEAEASRNRLALLVAASRAVAEARLDPPAVLATLAEGVAGAVGDGCTVRLLSPDGAWLDPAASFHPDPATRAASGAALDMGRTPADAGLYGEVVRSGRSRLIPVFADAPAEPPGEAERAFLRQIPLHSLLIVPLRARGGVIGTLAAWRDRTPWPYVEADRALLEDLADRAAIAVDNARLYDAAQAASRAKDDFLSTAAHELKTPVTSVKGFAQMLARWTPEQRAAHEATALAALARQCDRLTRLVDDLLAVSRLAVGRLELRRQAIDLVALTADALERMGGLAGDRRLSLAAPPALALEGDPDRIDQVLVNLLSNAIKFSPDGSPVEVTIGEEDGGAVVRVRDRGVGIPADKQAHLFERFYRAHAGTPDDRGGMGIGLHFSREIVERHGGRIWFESREGDGSVFAFRLPLATVAASDADADATAAD
jgi:PAS domain S-box-containing protein